MPGSSTSSFIFSGAKVVRLEWLHAVDGCETTTIGRLDNTTYTMVPSTTANTITIVEEADNSSGTGYKAVLTQTAITRVNKKQAYLDSANGYGSGCGMTDWVLNTAKDISGLTCGEEGTKDAAGAIQYTMWYINGTTMIFNSSDADKLTSVASDNYTKQ